MNSVVKAIATVIVALATLLCFSMVLWNESNKRTADSQQQIRGALQCELSDKIATLLGNERRATYSRLTFERVPNAPWEAVIHFQNLQSWRDQSDVLAFQTQTNSNH